MVTAKVNKVCLSARNLISWKHTKVESGCTLDTIRFTSMATGCNRFSVIEELRSLAFCKITASVSPRREYPELPNLYDNPLPSYIHIHIHIHTYIHTCMHACINAYIHTYIRTYTLGFATALLLEETNCL